jgi:hypothetical protein
VKGSERIDKAAQHHIRFYCLPRTYLKPSARDYVVKKANDRSGVIWTEQCSRTYLEVGPRQCISTDMGTKK